MCVSEYIKKVFHREKLCKIMGEDFTEHEMITIARGFSASCYNPRFDRAKIR